MPLSDRDKIDILLAEMTALYSLVVFRMNSLDKRLPIAAALLVGLLSSVTVLPKEPRILALMGLPWVLLFFFRTTINHARSFEDVLRRIDEIECELNLRAGEELIVFQSKHPSRKRAVGGRTGRESVTSVLVASLLALGAASMLYNETATPLWADIFYCIESGGMGLLLLFQYFYLRRYEYRKSRSEELSPELKIANKRREVAQGRTHPTLPLYLGYPCNFFLQPWSLGHRLLTSSYLRKDIAADAVRQASHRDFLSCQKDKGGNSPDEDD